MGEFLFMADAHIRSRTWTNSMQLGGDAYAALEKIPDELDRMVSYPPALRLVVGGDWFDSNRPSAEDLLRTRQFMRRFKYVGYIRGNHDSCSPSFLSSIFDDGDPWIGDGLTRVPGAWQLVGLDWNASADKVREDIAGMLSTADSRLPLYLVLHASFKHLLGFDGAYQLDAEWIKDTFKDRCVRVLVGDIHTRHTLELPHDGWIHSPGSLYPRSWDKVQEPCCVSLIDPDTGGIRDVPCDVRRYVQLEYAGQPELIKELQRMSEEHEDGMLDTFVRVVVPEGAPPLPRTSVPHVQLQSVSAIDDNEEAPGETPQAVADDRSLLQAVVEECGDDRDLADMASALVASDDPLKEIEQWLEYWKVERIA